MSRVIIHADDYAISRHVSECVAEEIKKGAIASISVMPNMSAAEDSVEFLKPCADKVLASVHLNLVEGRCVAEREKIPLLTDQNGFFRLSWLQIMFKSLNKEFREQIKIEFRAQIKKTRALLTDVGYKGKLRLDSHQHIHMIPGIFKTVCSLAGEFDVEYIRLTREPLLPFIKAKKFWKTYSVVNLAKNILLNLFSIPDGRLLKRLGLNYHYFFGLLITGKMDYDRVSYLIPLMPKAHDLEVVLHAGRMLESEVTKEYNKKAFIKEHISIRRLLELETVEQLNKKERL